MSFSDEQIERPTLDRREGDPMMTADNAPCKGRSGAMGGGSEGRVAILYLVTDQGMPISALRFDRESLFRA